MDSYRFHAIKTNKNKPVDIQYTFQYPLYASEEMVKILILNVLLKEMKF